jgi:predicted component of type VI protein secretion system
MDVRLVVDKGSTKQRTWHLHHKDTVIGRRRDCGLRILSAEVSRRHCLLRIDNGSLNVEDLDSINGTFINGQRIAGKQVLRPGDYLEIGPLQFLVEYELSQGTQDQLAEHGAGATAEHEEGSRAATDKTKKTDPRSARPDEDEASPLPVLDDSQAWRLPQTNDLRSLLSELEESDSRPRRNR